MKQRVLTNSTTGEKFIIEIDGVHLQLFTEKSGNRKCISKQTHKSENECERIGDEILNKRIDSAKHQPQADKWIIEGFPKKKTRRGSELILFLEETLNAKPLPELLKNFILSGDYLKFDKWGVRNVGGYGDVVLHFKNTLEKFHPSPRFVSEYPENLFVIAMIEEENQYADRLLIKIDETALPVYSDCHDRFYPHQLFLEFKSFNELIDNLISPAELNSIRKK